MFKTIFALLMAVSLFGYNADSAQDIIQKARQMDEEELFDFLSQEIANLDEETLQKNPELSFRRALVAFEQGLFFNRFGTIREDAAQDVLDGFSFVLQHAEPNSVLYEAAAFYKGAMQVVLQEANGGLFAIYTALDEYKAPFLKKLIPNQVVSVDDLRQTIFDHWKDSPDQMEGLAAVAVLLSGEADMILGFTKPDKVSLVGIRHGSLICKIESPGYTLTFDL